MKQDPQNSVVGSLIKWLHPMFLVAAGLHGFLLFVPLSSEETITVPEEEATEAITVSRIPNPPASNTPERSESGQSASSQSSASGAQSNSGGAAASSGASASRPGNGRSSEVEGGSGGSNPNRDVENEVADLSNDNGSNNSDTNDISDTVAVRGNNNADEDNRVDPLLAYAREISDRDQRQVSDALYAYVRALSLAYVYIPVDNTPAVIEKDIEDWINIIRIQANQPNLSPERIEDPLTIDYPLITCLTPPPESATLGVLVDANGEVIPVETSDEEMTITTAIAPLTGELSPNTVAKVIKGTGYRGLDHRALEVVSEQEFEDGNEVKAYLYEVQVNYDANNCIAVPNPSGPTNAAN
ncbi:MAG: hypothetical protein AAF215_19655 [Cyanobacteria bacterium P01_A01_bin.123]